MSSSEIDDYLAGLDATKRATLQHLRDDLHAIVPGLSEGMSYAVPAFRLGGALVAGFSAAAKHLSYLPHSGAVLGDMDPQVLAGYEYSKGALKFAVDEPLPRELVEALVSARLAEIQAKGRG